MITKAKILFISCVCIMGLSIGVPIGYLYCSSINKLPSAPEIPREYIDVEPQNTVRIYIDNLSEYNNTSGDYVNKSTATLHYEPTSNGTWCHDPNDWICYDVNNDEIPCDSYNVNIMLLK